MRENLQLADYTTAELDGRLEQYFGEDKEKVSKSRYQVIK